ncbi:TIGR01621 family pseudouridine synthase [Salinimonas sediminis]|uniref:TIGR01621 family pseudouridine synthase n=1 Tax=Salinimonas sediminis TaxID=2303538 RepID=A0A346NJY7_9ALTE|nr:TIGR01621 family pseudouridine synthase [Salinimonas sediminis]AXR05844.1 TIGR01621 family pseudouridine synthase [Salinimonas sediminis]
MEPVSLLYTHPDFYVIHKPAGVTMHDSKAGIIARTLPLVSDDALYLCHRLDDGTSGCLLLARHAAAAAYLGKLFATHRIQKFYVALATGKPKKKQGTISGDMKNRRQGQHILLSSTQHPAVTQFFSQAIAPGLRAFVVKPLTGKTHQIRVALKSLGTAILGDVLYKGTAAERMYLHAWQLQFTYRNELICVSCPPSSEFMHQPGFMPWLAQIDAVEKLNWPGYQLPR